MSGLQPRLSLQQISFHNSHKIESILQVLEDCTWANHDITATLMFNFVYKCFLRGVKEENSLFVDDCSNPSIMVYKEKPLYGKDIGFSLIAVWISNDVKEKGELLRSWTWSIYRDVFENRPSTLKLFPNTAEIANAFLVLCRDLGLNAKIHGELIGCALQRGNLLPREKPKSFVPSTISHNVSQAVYESWGFPWKSHEYLDSLIADQSKTLCLRRDGDEPVAWLLHYGFGMLGALYTAPGYRRQGLASYLVWRLTKNLLGEGGWIPCAVFMNDGTKIGSQKAFTNCGYTMISSTGLYFVEAFTTEREPTVQ